MIEPRFTCHVAHFTEDKKKEPHVFLNIVNTDRDPIYVTHAWIDGPEPLHINFDGPRCLFHRQPFSIFAPVSAVPGVMTYSGDDPKGLTRYFSMRGRIRVSTGEIYSSRLDESLPPIGACHVCVPSSKAAPEPEKPGNAVARKRVRR